MDKKSTQNLQIFEPPTEISNYTICTYLHILTGNAYTVHITYMLIIRTYMEWLIYIILLQFALVLTTLGLACDEVSWLFRHGNVQPPKAKHKCSVEDFVDK